MSSQPATMAETAGSAQAPLHRGIPDEIVVWEILVRLPPKALLRCRAVCPAWRRATSTRDFLLAHHTRQPSLPIVYHYEFGGRFCENIITIDHAQVQHIARFDEGDCVCLEASCDGLLVHTDSDGYFSICNPATHQYAPLPQLYGFKLFGMYPHSPTGEYRLLLRKWKDPAAYVFTLGSSLPPRNIEYPEAKEYIPSSVLFRGNLHWLVNQHLEESASNMIMVFDTTEELFHQMLAPAVSAYAELFEMGDMLGMACFMMEDNREYAQRTIDIFVMKDYESQVWAFKCRIELRVEEISMQCENYHNLANVVVLPLDGELFLLVHSHDCIHHVDFNGKLVASFYRGGLSPSKLRLKQTLVQHTFFSSLECYVVNDSPFIWRSNFSFLLERYDQEALALNVVV